MCIRDRREADGEHREVAHDGAERYRGDRPAHLRYGDFLDCHAHQIGDGERDGDAELSDPAEGGVALPQRLDGLGEQHEERNGHAQQDGYRELADPAFVLELSDDRRYPRSEEDTSLDGHRDPVSYTHLRAHETV